MHQSDLHLNVQDWHKYDCVFRTLNLKRYWYGNQFRGESVKNTYTASLFRAMAFHNGLGELQLNFYMAIIPLLHLVDRQ